MKITFLTCLISLVACIMANAQTTPSSSSGAGWKSLFDGKSLTGWRNAQKNTAPDSAWSVNNGELVFDPAKGHGGDITTTGSFTNFDLSLQFKISEGGNSGIKYFLLPNTSLGCEFQIIDDGKHPDAILGKNGNRKAGSLYDIIPANANKQIKPAGEWNTARIVASGAHVEHWLNGIKVVEFERASEQFKQAIAQSKFKTTKGFAEATSSPVLLQAHGDKVSFRDIKIKAL